MTKNHIELKYKDNSPLQTIDNIKACLHKVGIELDEYVHDAGIGNCFSAQVTVKNGYPLFANGKGVTVDLARASAYAEFIERLQCGLFLYKFQSIARDPDMYLHTFAPDAKFMTMNELMDNGEWMDYIIRTYGNGLTRHKLAQQCKMYACTTEDKILTLPYFSLLENKYVYLPAGFVEHIYASNGCCAGNSKEEAWVHAFSEMMERHCAIKMLTSESAAPKIPEEVIKKYDTPARIIKAIRKDQNYDIAVFDFSLNNGFPVIGIRLINKKTSDYLVNTAADPVFEIALSRGLTEIFQGHSITSANSMHGFSILSTNASIPMAHNVLNQTENGNGVFSSAFFAEELYKIRACDFDDNSKKNNKELLRYTLDIFQKIGKPIYVRNYSFLGFHSYHFVIPGFSEMRGPRLIEPIQEYALGDSIVEALRSPIVASNQDLAMLIMYYKKIQTAISRRNNFSGLAGLPISKGASDVLLYATCAYATYKLGQYSDTIQHIYALVKALNTVSNTINDNHISLLTCFQNYLKLKVQNVPSSEITLILNKFHNEQIVKIVLNSIEQNSTPLDKLLLNNCPNTCHNCLYKEHCSYDTVKKYMILTGNVYKNFSKGQDKTGLIIPDL